MDQQIFIKFQERLAMIQGTICKNLRVFGLDCSNFHAPQTKRGRGLHSQGASCTEHNYNQQSFSEPIQSVF